MTRVCVPLHHYIVNNTSYFEKLPFDVIIQVSIHFKYLILFYIGNIYYTNIVIHILGRVNLIIIKLHDNVSMEELYYIINGEYHTVLFYFI